MDLAVPHDGPGSASWSTWLCLMVNLALPHVHLALPHGSSGPGSMVHLALAPWFIWPDYPYCMAGLPRTAWPDYPVLHGRASSDMAEPHLTWPSLRSQNSWIP